VSRWTFVVRSAIADRLVVATAFVVVLLAATLVAAIPLYANAVAVSGLRERLARTPATEANVQARVDAFGGTDEARVDARVRRLVREAFGKTDVSIHASAESGSFSAAGRTVVFGFFEELPEHARLRAGRWPAAGGPVVDVVASEGVARELGLGVGDRIEARSRLDPGHVVVARLVGIFAPERPSSAYWWGSPAATDALGPLVASRESFLGLARQDAELRWRIEPSLAKLTIDRAPELRRALLRLPERLDEGRSAGQQFSLDTRLPEILAAAERSLRSARAGVLVPSVQLALLALYGLVVATGLLLERRASRTQSLLLRGASTGQLAVVALLEAALIAVPAVVLAPWLAAWSLHVLNHVGPLAAVDVRLAPHVSGGAYALAAAAGVVCVLALTVPVWLSRRVSIAGTRRRVPLAGFAQRARLDLVVAALALVGYWQLRRYHGLLVENRGGLGIDPFLVTAPALLLLAGALLSLRLVPFVATLAERRLASTRGTVAALGLWQLARRPRGYARSVLLLVLAVAIGVFATTFGATWRESQADQAWHEAGSDLLVDPGQAPGTPAPITLSSVYRALGATEAQPVATDSFDLARYGGESGTLLALDARRAQRVVHVRDDFASRPLGELLRPLAQGRGTLAALPLPDGTTRLGVTVRLEQAAGEPVRGLPPTDEQPLPPTTLYVHLRDADGVGYTYRLGELRPGPPRPFAVELGSTLPGGPAAGPRYPLGLVAFELDVGVPYVVSRRLTFDLDSVRVGTGRTGGWRTLAPGAGHRWLASATGFPRPYELPHVESLRTGRESVRLVMGSGAYLFSTVGGFGVGRPPTVKVTLRPGADAVPAALPVLASDAFLAATSTRVGDTFPLTLGAGQQVVRIAGSFHRFPTLPPETPAVVADLPSYVAASFARQTAMGPTPSWWLRAAGEPALGSRLRAPPFRSLTVVSRAELERAAVEDPVPLGVIGALALGFVVAAVFAAVGFAASATAATRSRLAELAVLRSLGLRTGQLAGSIALENAVVIVSSLLGGTALGLLVSWLVLPAVGLGAGGATPVPPVRLAVPWWTVLWLELALLAALAAVAAVQVARVRRLRLAVVLRGAEGAAAP